jgi:site-specific recombinase XerD
MNLTDLLPAYSEHLRNTAARNTAISYVCHVRYYLRTLPYDATLSDLSARALAAFISRLGDNHRPRTVAVHLAALRSFCDFLVGTGAISVNPAAKIKAPRLDLPRRETPTAAQVWAMFDATDRIHHAYRRHLARAVVSVLAYGALRRSELLALHLGDVDMAADCLYVRHGKGNRARIVHPGAECMRAIEDYLRLRPDCHLTHLFLLRKGFYVGDDGLRTLLCEIAAIAGLPGCKALLPHGLRHFCATNLLRNGADIEDIREFLGHADVTVTAVYLHSGMDRMRNVVAAMTTIPRPTPPPDPHPAPPAPPRSPLRLVDGAAS